MTTTPTQIDVYKKLADDFSVDASEIESIELQDLAGNTVTPTFAVDEKNVVTVNHRVI